MMKANPAYADKILEANQRLAAELRSCRKELEAKDETIARQADDIAWLKPVPLAVDRNGDAAVHDLHHHRIPVPADLPDGRRMVPLYSQIDGGLPGCQLVCAQSINISNRNPLLSLSFT